MKIRGARLGRYGGVFSSLHPVIGQGGLAWSYVSLHGNFELDIKARLDLDLREVA